MKKRQYRKGKRAAQQEETRRKIVEAAMTLHGEVGPRDTSVKAVAERAGVERLTVYRHFPDQDVLFQACSQHWLELNPPPDPSEWAGVGDVHVRRKTLLAKLFAYYRDTRSMWELVWRDRADVPALEEPMAAFDHYLDGLARDLAAGGKAQELRVTAGHVVAFPTWLSLENRRLSNAAKVRLVVQWIEAVAESR